MWEMSWWGLLHWLFYVAWCRELCKCRFLSSLWSGSGTGSGTRRRVSKHSSCPSSCLVPNKCGKRWVSQGEAWKPSFHRTILFFALLTIYSHGIIHPLEWLQIFPRCTKFKLFWRLYFISNKRLSWINPYPWKYYLKQKNWAHAPTSSEGETYLHNFLRLYHALSFLKSYSVWANYSSRSK